MRSGGKIIGLINYGSGNFASVHDALGTLEVTPKVVESPADLRQADAFILPGVGTFGHAMERLRDLNLVEALKEELLEHKKPYLGICLGMQILADRGHEFGEHAGLGIVPGEVHRLQLPEGHRLPHIGWNDIRVTRTGFLDESFDGLDFYFVHSYHLAPAREEHVLASCDCGVRFAAAVGKDRVFGVQFHPEKSQDAGRALLGRFLDFVQQC